MITIHFAMQGRQYHNTPTRPSKLVGSSIKTRTHNVEKNEINS